MKKKNRESQGRKDVQLLMAEFSIVTPLER